IYIVNIPPVVCEVILARPLSFAEVSSKFPQSGGTYLFAKKVLSVEAAFAIGWVVWFASIVAAVLYALGFGHFAAVAINEIWRGATGESPAWLLERPMICCLSIAATLFYLVSLIRKSAGGGQWANVGKVVVFAFLIACGLWVLPRSSATDVSQALRPFFAFGASGLFQAMGFTFIALQGFDLITAVAGEIRDPERTIPRAMLYSLGTALLIYLPLLFVVATVGMPVGKSVVDIGRENPETIMAIAVQNYLGPFGYWLVLVAAVLSMLSALQANLFAASRVAMSMALDRTLPRRMAWLDQQRKTPVTALIVTAFIVIVIMLVLPDVAAAGAAASLIFLITFALAHWIAILVRKRSVKHPPPFRTPLFPAVPIVGGLSCIALAIYQGISVPSAGLIATFWLSTGGLLFLGLFANRARIADASSTALDPEVVGLRGRSPLVLVPIANPDNARGLIAVANALTPPDVGRVMLLSVVVAPQGWNPIENPAPLQSSQQVLCEAIAESIAMGLYPEALSTVADQPWREISRVARAHRCESLLLGLSRLSEEVAGTPLDRLMSQVDSDIVVLRAPKGWQLADARRITVPIAGRGGHNRLLARLLASLSRSNHRDITFLKVLPMAATAQESRQAERELQRTARDLCLSDANVNVVSSDSTVGVVAECADRSDLLILGIQRFSRRRKLFGQFALQVAGKTSCPILLISRSG
ncbi:MAG: amino acid permease, partial [Planctomycetota bacterium]